MKHCEKLNRVTELCLNINHENWIQIEKKNERRIGNSKGHKMSRHVAVAKYE